MEPTSILYPAFAMFALSLFCIFSLGIMRFLAIQKREVKVSFYRTYNEGTQPHRLHLMSRHVQNHFEVPPLFYIGIIVCFITSSHSLTALVFAWLFVAARVVHTIIHLTANNVTYRFFTFGFSLICLCGLWISAFVSLISR